MWRENCQIDYGCQVSHPSKKQQISASAVDWSFRFSCSILLNYGFFNMSHTSRTRGLCGWVTCELLQYVPRRCTRKTLHHSKDIHGENAIFVYVFSITWIRAATHFLGIRGDKEMPQLWKACISIYLATVELGVWVWVLMHCHSGSPRSLVSQVTVLQRHGGWVQLSIVFFESQVNPHGLNLIFMDIIQQQ